MSEFAKFGDKGCIEQFLTTASEKFQRYLDPEKFDHDDSYLAGALYWARTAYGMADDRGYDDLAGWALKCVEVAEGERGRSPTD